LISIKKHSGIYTLTAHQELPISLSKAWDFFSSPENLAKITPKNMGFNITSDLGGKMYPGQIITYRIGILPGVKSNWVTEITQVKEGEFFIDEQRFGPYKMWHHEHIFEKSAQGVLMKDKVSYKLPMGFLGGMAHSLFVKKQLFEIFSYRNKVLKKFFPAS
jgi:ligand-binding SRPBCC domain-containing protein